MMLFFKFHNESGREQDFHFISSPFSTKISKDFQRKVPHQYKETVEANSLHHLTFFCCMLNKFLRFAVTCQRFARTKKRVMTPAIDIVTSTGWKKGDK